VDSPILGLVTEADSITRTARAQHSHTTMEQGQWHLPIYTCSSILHHCFWQFLQCLTYRLHAKQLKGVWNFGWVAVCWKMYSIYYLAQNSKWIISSIQWNRPCIFFITCCSLKSYGLFRLSIYHSLLYRWKTEKNIGHITRESVAHCVA
jgi:hypothetical protein